MTCYSFTGYFLSCSSECFIKLQTFMAENRNTSKDTEQELLVDDTSSDEESVDPNLKTTEEEK